MTRAEGRVFHTEGIASTKALKDERAFYAEESERRRVVWR